ncbi:hypothetical protein TrLO_g4705 [Triparma laevis f. longispina]|uniref:Uncharacterized protein n=1 Tax=Triparma laevis f. longispina TaxID=1714387 RepID=A0A9W7FB39_9STRA|nr:hypothetical protein TrLO_g4705 [Triparma laevis f. longispina]
MLAKRKMQASQLSAASSNSENYDVTNTNESELYFQSPEGDSSAKYMEGYGGDNQSHFTRGHESPETKITRGSSNPQMETPSPAGSRGVVMGIGMGRPKSFIEPLHLSPLLSQITSEIRTSGLRKGRENSLISLITELQTSLSDYTNQCKSVHKEWVKFSEDSMSLAGKCRKNKEDLILSNETLKMETAKREKRVGEILEENEIKMGESKKAEEYAKSELGKVKLECVETVKETKENAELRIQREVSRIKARLIKESSKKAQRCVEGVTVEYGRKVKVLKEKFEREEKGRKEREKEVEVLKGRLEEEERKYRIEVDEWKSTSEENEKGFESLVNENQGLLVENNKLQSSVSILREENMKTLKEQREKRRAELDDVEDRVKGVIRKKDELIRKLLDRAERAENRAVGVEKVLMEIDGNFRVSS